VYIGIAICRYHYKICQELSKNQRKLMGLSEIEDAI
jgi:hypothetical protein